MIPVLGHRGLVDRFAQNSLGALQDALGRCDGFETDVISSRDGVAFLIHEASYESPESGVRYDTGRHLDEASRILLGGRRLIDLDSGEIDDLRLRDGSRLPRLSAALALDGRQKTANLELKGPGSARATWCALAETAWPGRVCVSSSGLGLLAEYRRLDPRMPLALIVEPPEFPVAPMFPGAGNDYLPLSEATLSHPGLAAFRIDCVVTASHTIDTLSDLVSRGVWRGSWMAWTSADTGQGDVKAADILRQAQRLGMTSSLRGVIVDRVDCEASMNV